MVSEIWKSFRALPLWVQIWVFVILMPVNMASLLIWQQPNGLLIAVLANGAMALNGAIMLVERGFSRAMALPHVVIWTPLCLWLLSMLIGGEVSGGYASYLWVLLMIDTISLVFDMRDARDWRRGAREVAGR